MIEITNSGTVLKTENKQQGKARVYYGGKLSQSTLKVSK